MFIVKSLIFKVQLDVDPQRDDDASPMSTYRCMFETYLNDFSSSAQVKIQVKFNFDLF